MKLGLIIVAAFSIPAGVCSAAPANMPVWSLSKSLVSQLMPAVTVGKYQVQPPRGYTALHRLSGPGDSSGDAWAGPTRADGTRPYLLFVHVPIPASERSKYTLAQMSAKMLAGVERHRVGWKQSPTEQGTVNGTTFLRTYWQGTEAANGKPMHGFNYVAREESTLIQISSQDVDQHQQTALALSEASALTFKKL